MQYNTIIKGFNVFKKLVTKGYAQFAGEYVKFCRTWTDKKTGMKLSSFPFIKMVNKTDNFICMNLYSKEYFCAKLYTDNETPMKVSSLCIT